MANPSIPQILPNKAGVPIAYSRQKTLPILTGSTHDRPLQVPLDVVPDQRGVHQQREPLAGDEEQDIEELERLEHC